ncbi:hypothetical protein D3C84_945660 [compost metagenome]
MPEQLAFFSAMLGVVRNADARLDIHAVPVQAQRLGEDLADFFRHAAGVFAGVDAVQQYDKLITADARHGVGFAHAVREPIGDRLQQHVAHRVAVGVVDFLEAVEIDVQQSHQAAVCTGQGQ